MRLLLAALVVSVSLLGCYGEPDFLAKPYPTQCDTASILIRRGYPPNLADLITGPGGSCRAVRTQNMRGPDYTFWLPGIRTAEKNCNSPLAGLWTEEAPDGTIVAVNFCPEFCQMLQRQLWAELEQAVECPDRFGGRAGSGGAGAIGTAGAPAPAPAP